MDSEGETDGQYMLAISDNVETLVLVKGIARTICWDLAN